MPRLPLTTERLRLDPWEDAYAPLVARLSSLPEVTRHVGTSEVWTPERVDRSTTRVRDHWREHGFGWRIAVELATRTPVGLISLNFVGEGTAGLDPWEHEIGWWLDPAAWGRGHATEGAAAVRDEALERLGAPYVVACIQPANRASVRVAERLGLAYDFSTTGRLGEAFDVYRGP